MENASKEKVTIRATIKTPVEKVWEFWNNPTHVTKWNSPSDDWHTTKAENDIVKGGKFLFRMEAKDGSFGFDFNGVYDEVLVNEKISYTLGDDRKVEITFTETDKITEIVEIFEAETENPVEMQRGGWQAILNNFKQYAESN
ncbi:SRPBCC family protein [Reichenbachiella sp. MALMAid0571]|uniref:SRPBCC family protein n=1 Tax=Reichenbachiella sp. MALMAid0571 TaxID=3143939 RepID=UPI0032DF9FFE